MDSYTERTPAIRLRHCENRAPFRTLLLPEHTSEGVRVTGALESKNSTDCECKAQEIRMFREAARSI